MSFSQNASFENIDELLRLDTPLSVPQKKQNQVTGSSCDRFIPRRSNFDGDVAHYRMTSDENNNSVSSSQIEEYNRKLASTLLNKSEDSKILHFKESAPVADASHQNNLRVLYSQNKRAVTGSVSPVAKKAFRHIPSQPEKILDAPEFVDDYYLDLLSWNSSNVLAVALGPSMYLWNANSGEIECLCESSSPDNIITSVSWVHDANYLAIGFNDSEIQLWDAEKQKKLRTLTGHSARVSALDWNGHILSSGSRDTSILNHDVRLEKHMISSFTSHTQEVCGLKWSPDGTQLASGGNDNLVHIWNLEQSAPVHVLNQHQAAVKALAWCPWQNNLLATGGGSADRTIKFWNTSNAMCMNSIDTNSQVCALTWSKHEKEIVSAHGFSQNQISIWKYPSLAKVADLTGHTARILSMAQSPDGHTIVSASADETLRFWRCLDSNAAKSVAAKSIGSSSDMFKAMNIR